MSKLKVRIAEIDRWKGSIARGGDGMEERCCERIWSKYGYYLCSNKAKVYRDGKGYCKIHDPIAVEKRAKKREDEWKRRREETDKAREAYLRTIADDLLKREIKLLQDAVVDLYDGGVELDIPNDRFEEIVKLYRAIKDVRKSA